jgi:hypothetical protein
MLLSSAAGVTARAAAAGAAIDRGPTLLADGRGGILQIAARLQTRLSRARLVGPLEVRSSPAPRRRTRGGSTSNRGRFNMWVQLTRFHVLDIWAFLLTKFSKHAFTEFRISNFGLRASSFEL